MSDKDKVVDLPRVRGALKRLEEHLEAHPELKGGRTAAFLAGELEGAMLPRGDDMPQKVVKLPEELFERAAALLPRLEGTEALAAAGRPSTIAVVRLALTLGLLELEGRYPDGGGEE